METGASVVKDDRWYFCCCSKYKYKDKDKVKDDRWYFFCSKYTAVELQQNWIGRRYCVCQKRIYLKWFVYPSRHQPLLDKAPRLVFILILYLSNSTKRQILGRQCYLPFLLSQYHNFLSNLLIITVWKRYFITNSWEKSAPCIEILMCFRQSSQNSLRWYFISTSFYHSISSSTISHFPSTM